MEQIVDNISLDTVGYNYSREEATAAVFALNLYKNQLVAGNIITNPTEHPDYKDLLNLIDTLVLDIEKGMVTLIPSVHEAMVTIFFPYVTQMHNGLEWDMYEGVCGVLHVAPMDLEKNAETAMRIIERADLQITLLSD